MPTSRTRKTAASKKSTAKKAVSKSASNGEGNADAVYNVTSLGRRFVLSDVISQIKERRPPIEVEGDGIVFTIPPAELWPDEVTRLAGEDNERCCQLLLGDQYDEWVKQGGTFGVLNEVIGQTAGVGVGKSSPSSARSRSTRKRSSTT